MHSSARSIGTPRRAALVVCAAALVVALAFSISARAATGTKASTPRCATAGLVIWLDTQGNGAAGSIYYHLRLTNLSGHSCTLRGYPGVSAVNLAGHQLGSAASRDNAIPVTTVTLGRGATATAVLRIVEAGNFPAASCRQVTAAGLRVFPPGRRTAKVVPFPFAACSRRGPVYLSVRTVQS